MNIKTCEKPEGRNWHCVATYIHCSHAHLLPGSFLPHPLYLSKPLDSKLLHVPIYDIVAVRTQPQTVSGACSFLCRHIRVVPGPTGRCCCDVSSLTDVAVFSQIIRDGTERRRSTPTAFASRSFVEDCNGTLREIISSRLARPVRHFQHFRA